MAIGVSDGHVWRVAVDAVLTDLQKYDAQIGKGHDKGRTFKVIVEALDELGYWISPGCHNFRIAAIPTAVEMRLFRLRFERAATKAVRAFAAMLVRR